MSLPFDYLLFCYYVFFSIYPLLSWEKKPGNCLKKEKSQQLNVQIYIWLAHLFPVH